MGKRDEERAKKAQRTPSRHNRWLERLERSRMNKGAMDEQNKELKALKEELDAENTTTVTESRFKYFNQLPLSERTKMGLERANYKHMTPIQCDALPLALTGHDVLGAAKTGSGKTLCFVLPVLERLYLEHWTNEDGIGALVLSPTRELALQIFKVLQVVGYKHMLSAALLTGGRDVEEEKKRLHHINIIIGTPGRVLHHLTGDTNVITDNLQVLVMDEADRLLDMGFRECITSILNCLPTQRQTLLFSATQTTDVQMLVQMSLKNPRYVASHAMSVAPTPSTMSQSFLMVELHRKLDVLLMFLKRHPNDKIVVFVSTCNQVKFMYLAFSKILKKMRIPSMCLTSKMKQFRREEVFLTFCRCKSAVLFCTDIAARGLDFPLVHWVIQYDCPDSAQTYIHRAGRTARGGARGVNLLFLTPSEAPMLSYLASKRVPLREVKVKPQYMSESKEIFVALVVQGLKYEAQKAFIAYLRSVYFASNKHVFQVPAIDVEKFAHSLGLLVTPDLSELQQIQRGAKNLPWDVANYIARNGRKQAGKATAQKQQQRQEGSGSDANENEDSGSEAVQTGTKTRREKHLEASDLFRVMEQKQKYAPKNDKENDSDDDFLVKKPATQKERESAAQQHSGKGKPNAEDDSSKKLTFEERMAGLSKHKIRKYVEAADLRVRDLGLTHVERLASDDDDDDHDESTMGGRRRGAREEYVPVIIPPKRSSRASTRNDDGNEAGGASSSAGDESDDDDDGVDYGTRLRRRLQIQNAADADRSRQRRREKELRKKGKLDKKQTLSTSAAEAAKPGADDKESGDDEGDSNSEYASDVSDTSSLNELLKAARGELYDDDDGDDNENDGEDDDLNEYDEKDFEEESESEAESAPPPKKRQRN